MKIAIMTQPLGKNYGGIMQAWALQRVLKNAGHTPVTIDRQADGRSVYHHVVRLSIRMLKKSLGQWRVPINFERHLPVILSQPHKFINEHLRLSEPLDSTRKLLEHFERERYDAVIVGSDQTWRPRYSANIYNYFLDFLQGSDVKRLAYATSFGVDEWEFTEQQTHRCIPLAKQFEAISVREKSGVELCNKYLGVEASHVLDPTLLLPKESYEGLLFDRALPAREGIYTYILDQADWKDHVVDFAKKLLHMPIYSNQPKESMSSLSSSKLSDYAMPSLEGWLKGFSDADLVITDSFHGTVFSIIFNKPFISLVNSDRGASRFYSLVNELGLTTRLVSDFNETTLKELLASPVDYRGVEDKLCDLRKRSYRFLESNLKVG